MEYLIAGIRIDIPHRFTTGAFGMALAPFAAGSKTETAAGSNRMAGPVPGTATTAAPSPSETPGTERSAPHPAHGTARRRHGRLLRTRRIRLHRRRCRLPFRPRHGGLPAYHDTPRRQRPGTVPQSLRQPRRHERHHPGAQSGAVPLRAVDDVQHRRAGTPGGSRTLVGDQPGRARRTLPRRIGHACSTTTARSSGSPRKGLPKRQALPRQIRFPPCKAFSPAGRRGAAKPRVTAT